MKLLYVIEGISQTGGLERILINKMNALASQPGVEVVLLTVWRHQDVPAFPLNESIKHYSLDIPKPSCRLRLLLPLARILRRYGQMVQSISPDVVVHFRAMGAFLIGYGRHQCRTVFESHGIRWFSNHLWLYPRMERKVGTIVCLTNQDRMEYLQYGHCRDVRVIPNYTDIKPCASPDYSACHGLFMGRLADQKNPVRLLRLWHKVCGHVPSAQLHIYGEGELSQQVMREIKTLGMEANVVIHSMVTDVAQVLSQGGIMLLASKAEGLPMIILEAMTCGLPMVSLDSPCGPADLIEDGVTGFCTPYSDDDAFVRSVVRLISDEALRRDMGQAAQKRAMLYDRNAIIQTWLNLFSE